MQRDFMATQGDWLEQAFHEPDKHESWKEWRKKLPRPPDTIEAFGLTPPDGEFSRLPRLSFLIRIPFILRQPYLSKDERDFYVLDNPLRRERVFQAPMVAVTGWKGALRSALWQLGHRQEDQRVIRLFGNAREDEIGQAGRLHFFSTFFSASATLEIINPHDRATGVGVKRGPVLMECVPQKTKGEMLLLYVPFGSPKRTEPDLRLELAEDLELSAAGLHAMLTLYGFGAKTTSGFGTCDDLLPNGGTLFFRASLTAAGMPAPESKSSKTVTDLAGYLESPDRLRADLRRPDDSLKSEDEYRIFLEGMGKKYKKSDVQLYEKARKWWERREKARSVDEAPADTPPPPSPTVTQLPFSSLSELRDLSTRVAEELKGQGEI